MIYIIRHGQTQQNNQKELLGRRDVPLNEVGRRQAQQARQYFADNGITFDCSCSSPLIRAQQTAEIVTGGTFGSSAGTQLCTDERLIEMDYGPYEGASLENLPEELLFFFSDFVHHPAPDGMEPLSSVVRRAGEFMEDVARRQQGNLLISTHAIAMKGILEYLTPDSQGAYWSKYIGNCSVYQTEIRDGRFTVPTQVL